MSVIYIAPAPKYYSVGPQSMCSPQWYRPAWAMSAECRGGLAEDRGEELARRRDLTDFLRQLSQKRRDFFVFDPFDILCGAGVGYCTPVRNGRVIYRDDSHLTAEGAELLTPPFEQFLRQNGLVGAGSNAPTAHLIRAGAAGRLPVE